MFSLIASSVAEVIWDEPGAPFPMLAVSCADAGGAIA